MPELELAGGHIHYQDSGTDVPIVEVHGYTGNLNNWTALNTQLESSWRTIALDLPGHGRSGVRMQAQDYDLDTLAQSVLEFAQALGIGPFYLMGHSMGGTVAQHFAVAHADRLRGLVLVDTAATMPKLTRMEDRRRLVELARDEGMEAVFEAQLQGMQLSQRLQENPELIDAWRQEFLLTSREAYVYCAIAIAQRRPLIDELAKLDLPTLIVAGEFDEPFLEPSRVLHETIAGSRLEIMEGCNHAPFVEKPAEFAAVLQSFLAPLQAIARRSA